MAGYETKYEKLDISEKENLRKAYDYFVKAVQTEEFPMCGMDEPTVDYIIAVLAMEFGDYFDSSKLLSKLITSYSASGRLKDRARDVKEELADVLEILRSIAELNSKKLDTVVEVAKQKRLKRGGFEKRVFLEKTYKK